MTGAEETVLEVQAPLPGERLDVYLRRTLPAMSRGAIQRLLREGCIRVDNRPVKPTHHPRTGETIRIHWPEPRPATARPQEIPLEILFTDADLLVINKPPGMVVHPSAGHEDGTLVNALLHLCEDGLSGIGGVARPGIVHRLDQGTSGCLVVARNDHAHVTLAAQFAGREVEKVYHALVCGCVAPPRGDIRAAIGRHPTHRKRMAVVDGTGREARTIYQVLEQMPAAAWVEAVLHTGRTHQLRVHFKHIGFPLVGDATYGKRQNARLTQLTGYVAPRQMLHARRLAFRHPRTGAWLRFEAPWPADFEGALAVLREA